ncbi:hypothetical protein [Cyanobium sp. Morenito 9A2]|uniref:hypothetical protein n=1 Tax=Cyanobium sp. Morenito 9A2 TaxID=2823718 RepID=UPI0020CE2B7C|nr:hypothetical protein [Cyanobium sp. Morenito 9A2]MCP9848315.1 hypothetical protein [Cyanobium sp. Morenito 9A2]
MAPTHPKALTNAKKVMVKALPAHFVPCTSGICWSPQCDLFLQQPAERLDGVSDFRMASAPLMAAQDLPLALPGSPFGMRPGGWMPGQPSQGNSQQNGVIRRLPLLLRR